MPVMGEQISLCGQRVISICELLVTICVFSRCREIGGAPGGEGVGVMCQEIGGVKCLLRLVGVKTVAEQVST